MPIVGNPYHKGKGPGGGQFTSKAEEGAGYGGYAPTAFKRFTGSAGKIAKQAAKSFGGGRALRDVQVFRHVSPEFAKTLDGLSPGARMTKTVPMSTTLHSVKGGAMRIMVPKGSSARFSPTEDLEVSLPKNATLSYVGSDKDGNYTFRLAQGGGQAKPQYKPVATGRETMLGLKGMKAGSHPKTVSPLIVTASKLKEAEAGKYHRVDLAAMKQNKEQFNANMELFKSTSSYPNLRQKDLKGKSADEIANIVKDHVKSNLEFLYRNATDEEKAAGVWYVGANSIIKKDAKNYDLDDASVTGVYASLSPQVDWDLNVALAHRLIDIYKTKQDFDWDKDMTKTANELSHTEEGKPKLTAKGKPKRANAILKKIQGRKLSELKSASEKAAWIRVYDEAHSPDRSYKTVNPDGSFGGTLMTKGKKSREKVAHWAVSFPEMARAIQCLESDGDRQKISDALGEGTKVRSFYNNIIDPLNDNGELTVDTHAVGAGYLRPYPGGSIAVWHSMGLKPSDKQKAKLGVPWTPTSGVGSAETGITGTYGLYADAYREVAKKFGIRPNELQAIVWTVKRNTLLASDMSDDDVKTIDGLWSDYRNGKSELKDTQKAVLTYARNRQWERQGRTLEQLKASVEGMRIK